MCYHKLSHEHERSLGVHATFSLAGRMDFLFLWNRSWKLLLGNQCTGFVFFCICSVARGGTLIDQTPLESRSICHIGTLGKSFTRSCLWCFRMKLRHSIRAVLRSLLSSS